MPDEVYSFAVTISAGTTAAAPSTTTCRIPVRFIRRVVVKIPPGPSGFMGFRIAAAGVSIIPADNSQWVITDDEEIAWDVANMIQSGALQVIGYNTGVYNHTVYVRFEVDIPQLRDGLQTKSPIRL